MQLARALSAPILALAIVSVTPHAALAAPSPKDKADAKALVVDAKQAMKDKLWPMAISALLKARDLDPSLAVDVDLADAQIAAGRLLDAQKTLGALGAGGDKKLAETAAKKLAELKTRVPTVKVNVKGPTAGAKVTIDGKDAEAATAVPVDPGDHTVSASADGFAPAEKQMKLGEGERADIDLTLTPGGAAAPAGDAAPAAGNAAPATQESSGLGPRLPGIIVAGGGGAILVVGAIFGGLALSATSKAKSQCTGNACPPSAQGDIDHAKLMGNVSTGLLVTGAIVGAGGAVLAILAPFGKKSEEPAKAARVTPWIGAGQIGVAGSF